MADQPPELVTPEEACRIIGVTGMTTMYRRIREGKFPKPVRLGHASLRFVRSECHAYVQKLIDERDKADEDREAHVIEYQRKAAERARHALARRLEKKAAPSDGPA